MPRLEHYPFRYRDPRTGKWVRARYKTDLQTIADRHAEFEITGPPEIIEFTEGSGQFNPWRGPVGPDPLGNVGRIVAVTRPDVRLSPRAAIVGEAVPVAGRIEPGRA